MIAPIHIPTVMETLYALLAIFVLWRTHKFMKALKRIDYLPGMRVPFGPMSVLGVMTPTYWWNPGMGWCWDWRKTAYMNHTAEIISIVPFLLGVTTYHIGSVNVMKQLLEDERKTGLEKPQDFLIGVLQWGNSVFTANHDMWKRHRRIVAPAFTQKTYELIATETVAAYKEMLAAEDWESRTDFMVNNFNRIPVKVAITIISRCGFGLPMPWVDPQVDDGESYYGDDLRIVAATTIARLAIPSWAYKLPVRKLQDVDRAWKTLATFMDELVSRRRQEISSSSIEAKAQGGDIFTRLVAALDEDAKGGLDHQEVIGNTFVMMFAGHETTAHVLSATLALLAIHQEEQKKVIAEIRTVLNGNRDPTVDDTSKLPLLLSCFYETLRLFPSGDMLFRDTTEDVVIRLDHPEKKQLCLPKGSRLIFDMINIHHDPNTFPEPEKFIPSRWNDVAELDVSMFGVGPRACIGRKFSLIESMCFLAILLRDWKVDVDLADGETRDEYEERIMTKAKRIGLAFGVDSFDLKLSRRSPPPTQQDE